MIEQNADFLAAVQKGDVSTVARFLERDQSLAGANFHPESLHTTGFPLYSAAQRGDFEMVSLLLQSGADPDAKLDVDDPRELGMPLLNALHGNHYDVVHLILDYRPTLNAHPYCATPFVDQVFNNMWDSNRDYSPGEVWQYKEDAADEIAQLFSRSYAHYLNKSPMGDSATGDFDSSNASETPELTLLKRVVELGGQPSFFTLVRHELHSLIEELLMSCASEQGTPMDWPRGRVFDNILYGASWCGYPKTVELCMGTCPQIYSTEVAKHVIERAIRSHNRDGDVEQYFELIEDQLKFLKRHGAINPIFKDGRPFRPLLWLAEDFVEPSHYGFKCERLGTEDDMILLAKLFVDYGLNERSTHSETETAIQQTAEDNGWSNYADFLSKVDDNN